jgi:hypothetical protein
MNKKKIILKISIVPTILLIVFSLYSIDKSRCKNNENPLFTILTLYYKDGGTQYKIGIGYSIILWNRLAKINLNNTEISGTDRGREFVNFPLCYLNIFNNNVKPSMELQFFPDDNLKELYEANINESFNVKIIRNENHGLMNIIPCKVFICDENMELINIENINIFNFNEKQLNRIIDNYFYLIGGDVVFLTLDEGNYYIKVITPKEDQMRYFEVFNNDLESTIYGFKIVQNNYKEIRLVPEYDFKDIGTWIIE